MKKKLRKKIELIALVVSALLLLLIPFTVRHLNQDPLFTGGEFYYDLRASEDLSKGIYWDYSQDRPHKISFYHYLLSLFMSFENTNLLIGFSIILGIISLIFLYLILNEFLDERNLVIISSLLFALSPIFIYLFTIPSTFSLATVFSLIFMYLFIKKNYFSVPFLILVSITDSSVFLLNLILIISYYFYEGDKKIFLMNAIPSVISFFLFGYLHEGFQMFQNLFMNPSFTNYFTSFGAKAGIAFFYFFLGVIGLFMVWKRKREFLYLLISLLIVFLFSLFNVAGRIYFNFYLCIFSSITIFFLIKRTWAIQLIKKFTLLLILCIVIFSTALYVDQVINSEPKKELLSALAFLEAKPEEVVLSHQSYGHFIEYFSSQKSFLDDYSVNQDNYFILKDVEQRIFYSRNLETTKTLLIEGNVKYLLITEEMKKGLIWKREGEGLLFLIENSPDFDRLWANKGIQVWEVLYS
ncbi:hypothetical protein HQ533_02495 [Candidatus Woesearchaeota archaeon]|nr:hypothetical protein [Candidatus Woesearchaeota archaeon]